MPKKVEIEMDGVNKTVEVKTPKKKLCSMKDVVPASVIALVQANPRNDTIRNLLLAHTKVMVPASEDDFDKIKKWIEYNVAPPPKPKSSWELEMERQQAEIARHEAETQRQRANQVTIAVDAYEREHGRCAYHVDVRGQGGMRLNRDTISIIAAHAPDAENFFRQIKEALQENNPGDYIAMRHVAETESYEDYDSDDEPDYESREITIQAAGKNALKQALRTLSPDTYRRLFESNS